MNYTRMQGLRSIIDFLIILKNKIKRKKKFDTKISKRKRREYFKLCFIFISCESNKVVAKYAKFFMAFSYT